jgi:hypothetical protein
MCWKRNLKFKTFWDEVKNTKNIQKNRGQKLGFDNEKIKIPNYIRSKLNPKKDGSFQVLEWINDNAYKEDITWEYNTSDTFNVSNFSMFKVSDDSRFNPFEERMMRINKHP